MLEDEASDWEPPAACAGGIPVLGTHFDVIIKLAVYVGSV